MLLGNRQSQRFVGKPGFSSVLLENNEEPAAVADDDPLWRCEGACVHRGISTRSAQRAQAQHPLTKEYTLKDKGILHMIQGMFLISGVSWALWGCQTVHLDASLRRAMLLPNASRSKAGRCDFLGSLQVMACYPKSPLHP